MVVAKVDLKTYGHLIEPQTRVGHYIAALNGHDGPGNSTRPLKICDIASTWEKSYVCKNS